MDVMNVANIYTALQMNQVHSAVQTGLLEMAMNSQVQAAQNLIEDLAAVPVNPEHLGNNIDAYL
ncbi:MAG: putative motility protein [Firmicutes bacterium]|nr:putative motility protein [Bacillota bacterium]